MKLREGASTVAVVLAIGCALVSTGIMVRREFLATKLQDGMLSEPTPVKNWAKYAVGGHRLGPADATVTIIEFADFECPVCGTFERGALRSIRNQYPNDGAVIFRHWPLAYHKFAYPAARAAECAANQGRFPEFHDAIYAQQDSLGLKPFEAFAASVGVTDINAFEECATATEKVGAIEADAASAIEVGGKGTPTLIINGLLIPGAPDSAKLESFVATALKQARSSRGR